MGLLRCGSKSQTPEHRKPALYFNHGGGAMDSTLNFVCWTIHRDKMLMYTTSLGKVIGV